MVNIAVMGYGTVGSGVVEVVNTNGARINQRIGDELNIKYVLDLRDFPGDPVQEKIVHDFEKLRLFLIRRLFQHQGNTFHSGNAGVQNHRHLRTEG